MAESPPPVPVRIFPTHPHLLWDADASFPLTPCSPIGRDFPEPNFALGTPEPPTKCAADVSSADPSAHLHKLCTSGGTRRKHAGFMVKGKAPRPWPTAFRTPNEVHHRESSGGTGGLPTRVTSAAVAPVSWRPAADSWRSPVRRALRRGMRVPAAAPGEQALRLRAHRGWAC